MSDQPQYGHRYGRLPNDPGKPRLRLRLNAEAVLPQYPTAYDNATKISGRLDMLGNDRYGDCVAVTWSNDRFLVTTDLTDTPNYPALDQVLTLYKTQNPGFPSEDNGMVIQDALDYLRKSGGPDGVKAVAFAEVDFRDFDQLRAAVAIFGGVWLGITVSEANEQQFSNSAAWTPVPGSPILGGHAVPAVGYDPNTVHFLTWAAETKLTEAFRTQQVDEAWVVVWPEQLKDRQFLAGVDLDELASSFKQLTGEDLPIPGPTPTPEPTPGAASFLGEDPEVAARVTRNAARRHLSESDYLNKLLRSVFHLKSGE